jgi:hypothetical protein
MSTNSKISVMLPDGSIKAVYCHFDGYVSGVGVELLTYFDTYEKALELVEGGDIESISHGIIKRMNGINDEPYIHPNRNDFMSYCEEYMYLFLDNRWILVDNVCDNKIEGVVINLI